MRGKNSLSMYSTCHTSLLFLIVRMRNTNHPKVSCVESPLAIDFRHIYYLKSCFQETALGRGILRNFFFLNRDGFLMTMRAPQGNGESRIGLLLDR